MRRTQTPDIPYQPRQSLLSRGELAFYQVLRRSLRGTFGISIKTRLADIVECPQHLWDTPDGWRVSQKHVDFILYDRTTTRIVAVIELDDRSHDTAQRRRRDRFLNEVLESASVTFYRVRAAARYRVADLREHFRGILGEKASNPSNATHASANQRNSGTRSHTGS